ncbi:hypothetical protein NXS19_003410 [Fusarium pseudograminearum]|nr:hypothetical protein NXS19_003410 [Fusarium pseudograminearum]
MRHLEYIKKDARDLSGDTTWDRRWRITTIEPTLLLFLAFMPGILEETNIPPSPTHRQTTLPGYQKDAYYQLSDTNVSKHKRRVALQCSYLCSCDIPTSCIIIYPLELDAHGLWMSATEE